MLPGLTLIGIIGGVALVLLIIIIAVAVVVSKKNSDGSDSKTSGLGRHIAEQHTIWGAVVARSVPVAGHDRFQPDLHGPDGG